MQFLLLSFFGLGLLRGRGRGGEKEEEEEEEKEEKRRRREGGLGGWWIKEREYMKKIMENYAERDLLPGSSI